MMRTERRMRINSMAVQMTLLTGVVLALAVACRKAAPWRQEMDQARQAITADGRLDWFCANARSALHSADRRAEFLEASRARMKSLPGSAAFACRVDVDAATGKEVVVGTWISGLSAVGLVVGEANFVPSGVAWQRHRLERLTNGTYLFRVAN